MRSCCVLLMLALSLFMPGSADALTLNLDFGTTQYTGVGAAPDAGTFWNQVGPSGSAALADSNGNTTGISVATSFTNQYSNVGSGTNHPLLADRLYSYTPFETVTISGLAIGQYDLYAYAGFYAQNFSVNNANFYYATGLGYDVQPASWQQGVQYALLSGLQVTDGQLILTIFGAEPAFPGDNIASTIAGLQLQQTPLPTALPLLASGLGLLEYFRRRSRRRRASPL